MRFGFVVPHADARDFAELAALGEQHGWDGIFTWESLFGVDACGEFVQLDPPDPAAWTAAGATWWVESWWSVPTGPGGLAEVRRRVQAGPPI